MTEIKKSICNKALELIDLLNSVDDFDGDFVDTITSSISYGDTVAIEEISASL